ncbi:T-complex protein 11-like protein 1 isoform X1 [Bactrocera dorsalis]|uniref:T-complex protein 11-like protein 1 isoform X1 n=2 Tax=Bactrocera dorsalis TaxID=27457 RepID=A0ABM3JNU6_BACDO|nr:T-complex protein 11-like protein 1 isoform X1 [Bactrocera dorsalis]XP_049310879.1 T-complex protein 11-like protein 1 isoform X1 [Bactrocera dorsalis]
MPADSISRMDSNGSGGEANPPENLLGTSPGASSLRSRTESESSDKLTRFVLPSMDGSPPKVLTLNEVGDVLKNIQNMELVHEIAINPEFKFEPYEPPENSLERRIKDIMHKAFWDVLRGELNENPPRYDYALQLLAEIKDCFPQIISQNNTRALQHINEILDIDVLKQQAEEGVLDFRAYANFVIQIMAKSCAPARDEMVRQLTEITDVVDTFKNILETMALMKLDMVNCLLDFARNDIMANSVEYEKKKFKEYLEYYKFGFPATENWLKNSCAHDVNNVPSTPEQTISNAYMQLMDWDESMEFPEVLSVDKERILKLGQRAKRICTCAAVISICSGVPIISQRTENRVALAKQIEIILQGTTNKKELLDSIENVWLQVKTVITGYLQKENQPIMDTNTEDLLKSQIMQAGNKDSPVGQLMWKRFQTYFRLALRSRAGLPPPPPGYADFQDELEAYTTALKRVIAYNHSVFGEYFMRVLTQQPFASSAATVTTSDAGAAGGTTAKEQDSADNAAAAATAEQKAEQSQ